MGKAVVYVLTATVFALFFLISPSNFHNRSHQQATRRLGFKFPNPTFDPLVTEMERLAAEERGENAIGVDNQNHKIIDSYRNYYDEGRLNISLRLLVLFPLLDNSPKDGVISYEELSDWINGQAIERLNYRTTKQLEFYDKNGDDAISFHEYLPQFTEEDIGTCFFISLIMIEIS